ncbi:MAG: hypothetical protein AAF334_01350, partial [Pseudomonadota bacterium]
MIGVMTVAEADDLTMSARLFAAMYSHSGALVTESEAHSRLASLQSGPWRISELRMDGRQVGFALWVDLVEYVFIRSFAIDPARRRAGMGRAFLSQLR